jgi:hypothetical protein
MILLLLDTNNYYKFSKNLGYYINIFLLDWLLFNKYLKSEIIIIYYYLLL